MLLRCLKETNRKGDVYAEKCVSKWDVAWMLEKNTLLQIKGNDKKERNGECKLPKANKS